MNLYRRKFLSVATGGLAMGFLAPSSFAAVNHDRKFRAIAFDAFPIFDPSPVFSLAEELFPGKGRELGSAWRTRQFEYCWLRTLSGRYADFQTVTADALTYVMNMMKLELSPEKREALVTAYSRLKAWPDVLPALTALREGGIRLGLLSNFTREMLESNIEVSGLGGFYEHVLSTDQVRAFKPDPRAYQMAIDAFQVKREEIIFAAFAGWDAAGAKAFGYRTFWVNRQNAVSEELDSRPDTTGGMADLVTFASLATKGL